MGQVVKAMTPEVSLVIEKPIVLNEVYQAEDIGCVKHEALTPSPG